MGEVLHTRGNGAQKPSTSEERRKKIKKKNNEKLHQNSFTGAGANPLIRKAWLEEGIQLRKCPFDARNQLASPEQSVEVNSCASGRSTFCQRAQCTEPRNNRHSAGSCLSARAYC